MSMLVVSEGVHRIAKERERQLSEERFDEKHDMQHADNELAVAAACYAVTDVDKVVVVRLDRSIEDAWPWDRSWDKRHIHDQMRRLEIAGALIAAEIDRLLLKEAQREQDAETAKKIAQIFSENRNGPEK